MTQIHRTSRANPGGQDNRRPRPPAPPPPPWWRTWLPIIGALISIWLLFRLFVPATPPVTYSYSSFLNAVEHDQIATATIDSNGAVTGKLKDGRQYDTQIPTAIRDDSLAQLLESHKVAISATGPPGPTLLGFVESLLPFLLLLGFFLYMGRRAGRQLAGLGGIMGNRAKVYDADRPQTRFSDIAGYEGAKQEVTEVVDFLKNPERYRRAGAMGPRGVLLVGPPGTGKTLLARAVAGEAQVPFFALSGSSFVEVFVGVGAARVRDLFSDARKRAPAIVFIDEIDAIGQRRGGQLVSNDEREQTLNQLLAELDGFEPSTGVVVMAATNRPETLDPALLRPGRFDRQVEIPLPNQRERAAILAVHSRGKKLGPAVDLDVVARGTPGFSGADLANLINEAAIFAVRGGRDTITPDDFFAARDRIILGRRESSNALLPEEKRSVAVHESGHAMVAALSEHADPILKVTILPAGQALGVTEQLPVDDRHLYPESYLKDSLAVRLGGRAAEVTILGEVSTGAANDLAGATDLATRMVRDFGMSPRLGPVGFSSQQPQYLGGQELQSRPFAEATQRVIDEEVSRLLAEAEQRATELLTGHRDALDGLVDLLLERETIDGEEVDRILGIAPRERTPASRPVEPAAAAASASRAGASSTAIGDHDHGRPATGG